MKAASVSGAEARGLPQLRKQGSATQLSVDSQPLVMLSGELHNSSSSSLDYLKPIWPKLAALNLNTVIASLSWELVEPEEGKFDFSLADGLIESARQHQLKLVLIWFGTWKNYDATYAPAWVKTNWIRFPRCQHRPGRNTTQLSAISEATVRADARAFAALMRHIKQVDGERHTVVMMQVENESGVLPASRDRSPPAEEAFAEAVPVELMSYLVAHKESLIQGCGALVVRVTVGRPFLRGEVAPRRKQAGVQAQGMPDIVKADGQREGDDFESCHRNIRSSPEGRMALT